MIDALQFLPTPPAQSLLYVGTYNPAWVVISVLLAILASYAALNASSRVERLNNDASRLTWTLISALTLGIGIWAMHFIGMLALSLPCGIYYDPFVTLLSMVPGILASGVALGVLWNHGNRHLSPLTGSILLGAGIGTMHYTGMAAIRMEGFVRYDPTLFASSIIVAVALSYLALRVKNGVVCLKKRCNALVAVIMGCAVSGMHYTAMSAAYFVRGDVAALPASVFTTDTLAFLIALITVFLALAALALATISRNREMNDQLRESEERWKFALEGAGDGVWDWNPQTDKALFSKRWKEMIGYAEDEFPDIGAAWLDSLHPDDRERVLSNIRGYLAGKEPFYVVEFRMRHKDGSWKWIMARGMLVSRDAKGKPLRMIGTHSDISERKRSEEALRLHASVFDNTWEGIMITEADGNIIAVNEAFTEVSGYARDEVLGKNPRLLKSERHDPSFYKEMWHSISTAGHWRGEVWNRNKNGTLYAEILSISAVRNTQGELTNYIGAFADITDLKNTQQHLESLANYDTLTRLPNRRLLLDRLGQELKKAHRAGQRFALMLIDLDNFKEVNDTLGHDKGDTLLVETALRISECVRESDTVARLGGDEFAIILPGIEDTSNVERVAQHIISRLINPFQLDDEQAFISASIGITFYPIDATDAETLMKNADQAMYQSKSQGRNRFSYFTVTLQEDAQNRMRLLGDLRNALAKQQFCVYYQPIIELASGHIRKAEALIRWNHPVRGLVGPAEFIPLTEETGLIVEIGEWVYQQATRQVAHWRTAFDKDFQVSVNRSPVQFRVNSTLQRHWRNDLEKLGLPGQSIVFEITEGLLLNAEQEIQNELMAFHDAGVRVAIDDFGTGYSSLAYLRKFDIDFLKIDQVFVRNLQRGSDDLVLIEAIVVMAHKLGLKVIAEGVETIQQKDLLVEAGCDYAQGYLFSRPVPADEFELMLSRKKN
ncbi:MAG: EAL domain-containing protein [Nitrosomonadales bacterium]|nr:EAL domain-containing protein [Nitrosomonadales bacterium]